MLPIPLLLCFSLYLQTTQSQVAPKRSENNVCRSILAYSIVRMSRNCFYDPNVESTLLAMVLRNGYPIEQHEIITPDGYILTVSRIFKNDRKKRQPVILQHGIGASGAIWVLRGATGLAFKLHDNGYDVWLPNIRGSTDSNKHVKLSNSEKEFWDFEFEDIALKDLPSIIDKIANVTGQKGNIIYMGHSMGTTVSYVYCSLMKSHCEENLKGLVSFSPVAYLRHISSALKLASAFSNVILFTLKQLGIYVLAGNGRIRKFLISFCSNFPTIKLCTMLNVLGTGLAVKEVMPELIPVIVSYFPVGISVKTLEHYAQIAGTGEFKRFDYGKAENLARYNSTVPPNYDLGAIGLPVYFFVGQADSIAADLDVNQLRSEMTSIPVSEKFLYDYAHNDFFAGRFVIKFYRDLLGVLRRIGSS